MSSIFQHTSIDFGGLVFRTLASKDEEIIHSIDYLCSCTTFSLFGTSFIGNIINQMFQVLYIKKRSAKIITFR